MLKDIPIRVDVETTGSDKPQLAPTGKAILYELETLLGKLVTAGEGGSIDLRRLPLAPGEHDRLKTFLGAGEVSARVDSLGPTYIQETAYAGVWWVTHHNQSEQIIGEFIEVATIPQMLEVYIEDCDRSLSVLRKTLAEQDKN